MSDTIVARVTGAGRAAVAVLRISGPDTARLLSRLAGPPPAPRQASVRTLRAQTGEAIDQALVLWMPGPKSFTGEDCAELHVHGGAAVIEGVTEALLHAGARPAEAGEFSRRAFTNGKLDLLQAEAVADLVDAETEAQRRQALGQLGGEATLRYQEWRTRLVKALAFVEAELDFPDEDLPGALSQRARPEITALARELERVLSDARRGQQVRAGYAIAIVGAPNAGKSSLFNSLLRREAAIVSARPGTTRDIVEAQLRIHGFTVLLADTAGIRNTEDEVEAEGVSRAEAFAKGAALRLLVVDPTQPYDLQPLSLVGQAGDLLVLSKADLPALSDLALREWANAREMAVIQTSVRVETGVRELQAAIAERVRQELGSAEQPLVTRARHEAAIRAALNALEDAREVLDHAPEEAAEDIRHGINALQSIVGRVDRDAVLDEVFSSFCIGK